MLKPVNQNKINLIVRDLHQLKKVCAGKPFIMVTAMTIGHNYLKLLFSLKKAGVVVILVLAEKKMCNAVSFDDIEADQFFDRLYTLNPYIREMPLIARRVPFDLIHAVVGTHAPGPFAELVNTSQSPVVTDYYDFRQLMFDRDADMKRYFGIADLQTEKKEWRQIFVKSGGIVHIDSSEIIERLAECYDHTPKKLAFGSYICRSFSNSVKTAPQEGGPLPKKIVFTGGLQNNRYSHGYIQHSSIIKIAEQLADLGFEFTIINASDRDGTGFDNYLKQSERIPGFHYRTAVSGNRLSHHLQEYDLGWNVLDFENGSESAYYYKTLMSSKLFDYLQAGLPVVVSDVTAHVTDFVRDNGIGIVVNYKNLNDLATIVAHTNWQRIHENIRIAQNKYSMEVNLPRLFSFYNQVCDSDVFSSNCAVKNPKTDVLPKKKTG